MIDPETTPASSAWLPKLEENGLSSPVNVSGVTITLPDEMVNKLLGHFDSASLRTCRAVCKRFCRIIDGEQSLTPKPDLPVFSLDRYHSQYRGWLIRCGALDIVEHLDARTGNYWFPTLLRGAVREVLTRADYYHCEKKSVVDGDPASLPSFTPDGGYLLIKESLPYEGEGIPQSFFQVMRLEEGGELTTVTRYPLLGYNNFYFQCGEEFVIRNQSQLAIGRVGPDGRWQESARFALPFHGCPHYKRITSPDGKQALLMCRLSQP